jgi:hypothetical protein
MIAGRKYLNGGEIQNGRKRIKRSGIKVHIKPAK